MLLGQSPDLVAPPGCRSRARGGVANDVQSFASGFGVRGHKYKYRYGECEGREQDGSDEHTHWNLSPFHLSDFRRRSVLTYCRGFAVELQ